jgi:hypothetical protein
MGHGEVIVTVVPESANAPVPLPVVYGCITGVPTAPVESVEVEPTEPAPAPTVKAADQGGVSTPVRVAVCEAPDESVTATATLLMVTPGASAGPAKTS